VAIVDVKVFFKASIIQSNDSSYFSCLILTIGVYLFMLVHQIGKVFYLDECCGLTLQLTTRTMQPLTSSSLPRTSGMGRRMDKS